MTTNTSNVFDHLKQTKNGQYFAGSHLIFDFYGVDQKLLNNSDFLREHMIKACELAGATVLSDNFHHFGEESGVTGVICLSESHMSTHSWPEVNLATFDIFMCGIADPLTAYEYLKTVFCPTNVDFKDLKRGKITKNKMVK